jgi:hypothetical protein
MSFRQILAGLCLGVLAACANEPNKQVRMVAMVPSDPGVQAMAGFQMVSMDDRSQKFSYQEHGYFLISNKRFQTRAEASAFCRSFPGYELSEWLLPALMTVSTLPFDDLRMNNRVERPVLSGEHTLGGNPVTGTLFWVRGKTIRQEKELTAHPDMVYEMLDGCGAGCEGIEPLSAVNSRLRQTGWQTSVNPQAVCTEPTLEKKISK